MTAKRRREILLLILTILFLGLFLTAFFLWIFTRETASSHFLRTCFVFLVLLFGFCAFVTARYYGRYKLRFRILIKEARKRKIRIRRRKETGIMVSVRKPEKS